MGKHEEKHLALSQSKLHGLERSAAAGGAMTDVSTCSPRVEFPDLIHISSQVYGLGDKAELLVAVRQPEGPGGATTVALTADVATPAVMHWGVKRRGKRGEWLRPPDEVPDSSECI